MTTHRYQMWESKNGKYKDHLCSEIEGITSNTRCLCSTVHRAHHQTIVWQSATQSDPPILDPVQYGWHAGEDGTTLHPITLPAGVSAAPLTILHLIKCGCSTSRPCSTGRCGCVAAQMSCSMFCCCNAGSDCFNEHTGQDSSC